MGRFALKLPDLGEGTTQAELVVWHVKVGDVVTEDQPLVDVMTEKATVEIPAPVSGKVLSITGDVGQVLAVGTELVVLETASDSADAPAESAKPSSQPVTDSVAQKSAKAPTHVASEPLPVPATAAAAASSPSSPKPTASPSVRNRAKELGVLLQFVPGTGPGARVTQLDLDNYLRTGGAKAAAPKASRVRNEGVTEVKVVGLRRVIAERMQETKRRMPHFSYIEEVDVTDLEDARGQLNAKWAGSRAKLTLLPFLIAAIRKSVADFPEVNARYDDSNGVINRYAAVHAGIATQTPQGLMVPVVRHVEALDLWETAQEVQRLSKAAREGRSIKEDLTGSTITITSLGALGGIATTPIINAPEVSIVGVNKIVERPIVRQGRIVVRKVMNLSSSFDHRVIDGAVAAEFIQAIRTLLEAPALLVTE